MYKVYIRSVKGAHACHFSLVYCPKEKGERIDIDASIYIGVCVYVCVYTYTLAGQL